MVGGIQSCLFVVLSGAGVHSSGDAVGSTARFLCNSWRVEHSHILPYLLNVREFSQRWLGTSAVNHYWRQPSDEVKTVMKVCHPIDPHFPIISAAKSWVPLVLEDKVKTGATDRKTE